MGTIEHLELVLTEVDGVAIGLLAHQVEHSKPCPASVSAMPKLTEWLGLLSAEPSSHIALSLCLADGFSLDVCCSAPVTLVSVPNSAVFSLPALLAARCQIRGLSALAMHNARPVFVIDLSLLRGDS
ncbi:MAG: hypothetical protein M1572_01820 [Gammaproteobacteria bacterium]|nr:hypothetical protein [Gammaproteobacteria bacterium]OYY25281.1 MAG: hypothetical protein B7Y68_00965 [Thiotrichales bacterium 35-46-9]OZA95662.1 MAG: hypothetical protein B7X52_06790 [Thiotrichales bacterium 34-46-19]HQR82532.1 hypothetical protein [Thiotrichales bacterium]HQR95280.1 hypothetical protein [Thiotrichales bacterium]